MIYKDIQPGQAFTFYEMGSPRIALKLTTDDSVLLKSGEIIHLRPNKNVHPIEEIDPHQFRLAYVRDRLVFAQELSNSHFFVLDFIVMSAETALKDTVKLLETQAKTADILSGETRRQVDIIFLSLHTCLTSLRNIVKAGLLVEVDIIVPLFVQRLDRLQALVETLAGIFHVDIMLGPSDPKILCQLQPGKMPEQTN